MENEIKIDKRSKEYKDMLQDKKDAQLKKEFEAENTLKIRDMEKKMEEMESLLRNVGTVTADNAKKLTANSSNINNKDKSNNSTSINDIKKALGVKTKGRIKNHKISYPRNEEFRVLSNFVYDIAPQISLDKELVIKIGVCLMYKDVGNLFEYIKRDDYLRKKALEAGIVSPDFTTIIIPPKK